MDPQFPAYRALLFPRDHAATVVQVEPQALLLAIRQIEAANVLDVVLHIAADRIRVTGRDLVNQADVGEAIVDASADGPDLKIGINPGFLTDALSGVGNDRADGDALAELWLTTPTKPIMVSDPRRDDRATMVMPVRLPG